MKTIYSPRHALHCPRCESAYGSLFEYTETPDRASYILKAIRERVRSVIIEPRQFSLAPILAIHDEAYVAFLRDAYSEWTKERKDASGDAFAGSFNVQHPDSPPPQSIFGKLGFYTADGYVPITKTSWEAIKESAFVALTAQEEIRAGETSIFALCRPPGHHATGRVAAGYCFLNNAAVAAQASIDNGAKRVAIIDLDYHHGNGTQKIFYDRDDVLFVSIHCNPAVAYPYFCGYAEEKGRGQGEGYTINYPLPIQTSFHTYDKALTAALKEISNYGPDATVVSLGVDTYKHDPISKFLLESSDFLKVGAAIGTLDGPVLFVMEGGYAVDQIGHNVVNVLTGFLDRRA